MNTTHAISISRLTKIFPGSGFRAPAAAVRPVLDDISLEVASGEIVGLLGANGAGKTTLVEILATYLLPTSGEARICGHNVEREMGAVRRLVGYAPSVAESFFPRLSVRGNLEFFATLYDLDQPARERRIEELLGLVGLDEAQASSFQKLSLGMQQRLALARALLADPPVLLLDEPTRSLDPAMQKYTHLLLTEVLKARQGKTILLVTHSIPEVEAVCDRVAILSGGRLVACGTPREVTSLARCHVLGEAFDRLTGHGVDEAGQPVAQKGGRG